MSTNKLSKFNDLFEQKSQETKAAKPKPITPSALAEGAQPNNIEQPTAPAQLTSEVKRGRKATGKRSNPEWQPFTVFARTDTLKQVEIELIKMGYKNKLSDLVDSLFTDWLASPRPPQRG